MRWLFDGCKSLSSLPDISKWNTNNVTHMSYMFFGCESLSSLPDILNKNIKNVTNKEDDFVILEKEPKNKDEYKKQEKKTKKSKKKGCIIL